MFQSKIYNYAIDVWSLGLVFAELLFLTKEAFVEGKAWSGCIGLDVCCSGKCKGIASLIATKGFSKHLVIVLDPLVISEKGRVWVVSACRMISIAKEVQLFSCHFLNPFHLILSVHTRVSAEVIDRVSFELVGCS